jgi:hypothetical protein
MQLWVELWVGVFSGFRSNLLKNMVGAWDSNPRPLRADRTCSMSIPSRSAGLVLADSDLALIIRAAADESFAHEGMSPQRTSDNSRMGSVGF